MLVQGCRDLGSEPIVAPVITAIAPDSAAVGDTISVIGSGFGDVQGSSRMLIGGATADTIVSWSATEIHAKVPSGAIIGEIRVEVNGRTSNVATFSLTSAAALISFSRDVLPIFMARGCYACHGGSGGLVLQTVAGLLRGGIHGPAIVPGNAAASLIIQKTSPTPPFGDRMPQGGPYLDSATELILITWINQGARDN